MTEDADNHHISSIAELEALYGFPIGAAVLKEINHISDHYRAFIEASPFMILATAGEDGLDCSPRGDPKGFVRVADDKTLMIPDRRGNNRLDSLRNILRDPRVALLFLVPGVGETMRVNGRAAISTDPALLESFAMDGKAPKSVIVVAVDSIYPQCQKALIRSKLWDPAIQIERSELPTIGQMMEELAAKRKEVFDGAAYDAAYPERLRQTIY